jgi:hypothetical protein
VGSSPAGRSKLLKIRYLQRTAAKNRSKNLRNGVAKRCMASTYRRADSPFIWIRYKSDTGVWKSANTGYRQDNIGDRKQAELLAKRESLEEMANKPVRIASHRWEDWGIPWINGRWGNRSNRTPKMYTSYFWRWLNYFKEIDVTQPVALQHSLRGGD